MSGTRAKATKQMSNHKQLDLLVLNIGQLATCASPTGPKRGAALQDVGLIEQAAIAVDAGKIVAVGDSAEISATYRATRTLDAHGRAVIPGFVDCHTHVVYGGSRVHEFEMRIQGATYMDIMAAGGGIVSTMRQTRAASIDELVAMAAARLDTMLTLGSTTVEIKTGYGLDTATELNMLQAIEQLDLSHACQLVPTFLGAHTLPPEYKAQPDRYVDLIVTEMLPAVADWYAQSHFPLRRIPLFIDVFCEDHAFDVAQTRRLLAAGIDHGMRAKLHVDQFNSFGGLPMALELGIVSADHLEATVDVDIERMADSDTLAVLMPAVNFNLGLNSFAPGRKLVDAGAAVALATDMNPGSAPCFSMPLTMAIACRYLRLTPAEALNASTLNAAHALGLGQTIGSLEVGKAADFLILDSVDYRDLTYLLGHNLVKTVVRSGELQ